MKSKVNKVTNPDFSQGKREPRGWEWYSQLADARWRRADRDDQPAPDGCPGGVIISRNAGSIASRQGAAYFSQVLVCKPGEFYRVEATVQCDLTPAPDAAANAAGFVIAIEPCETRRAKSRSRETAGNRQSTISDLLRSSIFDLPTSLRVTPAVLRATDPVAVRAYFQAPEDTRRVRLSVGLRHASGTATIRHVRFIPILEPEETSHPMALPPPGYALEKPSRVVRRVCVCSTLGVERPLTRLLRLWFSEANVRPANPSDFDPAKVSADAALFPDASLPRNIRSFSVLETLAQDRIVVVSLPAFASLAPRSLHIRRIEQQDDPIHAKVAYGNDATRGFALHDIFPFAWCGKTVGSFVQNHFQQTDALERFCKKHELRALLLSMCNRESTSDRAVCLFKKTARGALYVLDLDALQAESSSFGEPVPGVHLLLSILGQTGHGLGQFSTPIRKESELREMIRELGVRLPAFVVHDDGLPVEEISEQYVTVGGEDRSYGLPLSPRPLILIRSGLTPGDIESFFAALQWIKQLVRPEPHACPYAAKLLARFRIRWVPLAGHRPGGTAAPAVKQPLARCQPRDGWARADWVQASAKSVAAEARPGASDPSCPLTEEARLADAGQPIAALIDILSRPVNRERVVLARADGIARYERWLGRLMHEFGPGCVLTFGVEDGDSFEDRDRFQWRVDRPQVEVGVEPESFQEDWHGMVLSRGGETVRIELPGCDADFSAQSIHRTDVAATMLEHVIGLHYGLIAVNRRNETINFDGYGPVSPGQAVTLDRDDPLLQAAASRAG